MAFAAGVAATNSITTSVPSVCLNGLCGRCRCDWILSFLAKNCLPSQWPLRPVSLRRICFCICYRAHYVSMASAAGVAATCGRPSPTTRSCLNGLCGRYRCDTNSNCLRFYVSMASAAGITAADQYPPLVQLAQEPDIRPYDYLGRRFQQPQAIACDALGHALAEAIVRDVIDQNPGAHGSAEPGRSPHCSTTDHATQGDSLHLQIQTPSHGTARTRPHH
jgi:hypothetical protein